MRLSWPLPNGYDHYQVWRGDSPYFDLGGPEAGLVTETPWQFDDADALVDPVANRYYRVVGFKTDGGATISQCVGEFDFGLAPGGV